MDIDTPPLSQGNEPATLGEPKFVSKCYATLNALRSQGTIEIGPHITTMNDEFGVVFRMDYTINGKSIPGLVNRFVAWTRSDGNIGAIFAVGQEINRISAK
jgi:hypothetical protein